VSKHSDEQLRKAAYIHPAAEILPMMSEGEIKELAEDIKKNGQREPVTIIPYKDGYALLDGRGRLAACQLLGIRVRESYILNPIDPYAFVLSMNLHRRHLTAEQKRNVIAAVLKHNAEQSNRQAAKKTGTDHKTVGKVREELEGRGEIPHVETREDTKGRKQPGKRPKRSKAQKIKGLIPAIQEMVDVGKLTPLIAWQVAKEVCPAYQEELAARGPEHVQNHIHEFSWVRRAEGLSSVGLYDPQPSPLPDHTESGAANATPCLPRL
jgi:ParB-like chromosome segregation protein Spo0J